MPMRPEAPALRLEADCAVETASLFALGLKRLAADLGLIRMLIYYGTPQSHEDHHRAEGWHYPQLGPRALRILEIDPAFSYAALYASVALAFNLSRPQEALDLLEHVLKRDPGNRQYQLYIAAIGFQREGNSRKVIELLEPVLNSPDCPTMIKSMMAFLYKKSGQLDKAVRLYQEIIETSRDSGYRGTAERMLAEIRAGRPALPTSRPPTEPRPRK